jgi:hypothetical protein
MILYIFITIFERGFFSLHSGGKAPNSSLERGGFLANTQFTVGALPPNSSG